VLYFVVARDGIEPPTPAFSGLDSSRAIAFETKGESRLNVPKTTCLLGQEWDKILAGQDCLSLLSFPIPKHLPRPPNRMSQKISTEWKMMVVPV